MLFLFISYGCSFLLLLAAVCSFSSDIGLLFVLFFILMLINLRGVRESSTIFVIPTYAFVVGILALIFTGVYHAFTQEAPALPPESLEKQFHWGMTLILLRAFANGCSSMTGIEAISNGVPMFKKPEV
ncbi:MAG: amino acid permease, partial [Clostridiaceae bacterium]